MLIYLGTFAASVGIAAYGEHLRTKKNNEKGFYLCLALAVLVMAVLAGLRDPSIGTDSVVYEGWVADAKLQDGLLACIRQRHKTEPLFMTLVYLAAHVFGDVHWLYFMVDLLACGLFMIGLGCIELVQQGQALHEQLRVIGERVAAQRGNVFCQPAGDHQRSRLTQFFLDALHHAVNEHRRTHHRAGKHTLFGIGADGALGRTQMHLRQLGAALPQGPQPGGKPRADHTAPEHPVLVHYIKSSSGAQVHRDHRQREVCRRIGSIHQPVLAHGMGVRHPHGQACADLQRNDDRLFAGVIAGALSQCPGDLGHYAGQHRALEPDGLFRVAAVSKHLLHFNAVFRGGTGAHRIHVGHKAYTSVLDAAQGDGGVAYING